MRLFVAVEPTATLKDWVAEAASRLGPLSGGLRWLPPENAHLTLAFLGETAEDGVGRAREALSASVRGRPRFALELSGLGAFESWRRVKVVWAGVKGGADALLALAHAVRRELETRGFPLERRDFAAHLTLARSPDGGPQPALEKATLPPSPPVPVDAIALIRSELGRIRTQGPGPIAARYEALERFFLE